MIPHPHVTGVILAGGRATRMGGADKGALVLGPGPGDTPLARILGLFMSRFPGAVLVGAADRDARVVQGFPAVTCVTDAIPGCGPLGGIHAALGVVATPLAFVCGVDMPSLCGPLIDRMVQHARPDRLLVPIRSGRPEPLHAIYPVSCRPEVERALNAGVRKMTDFFMGVPVDYLDEADYAGIPGAARSFDNINTPEDMERFRS